MKGFFSRILGIYNNLNPNYKFVFLLLILAVLYQYPSISFKRPQTIHHWRQSDCASFALNYYQSGMHFFHPQTNNLTSDNDTTSYTATSEIPILYYFVAILYKIFGYHDFIYRILNTLIFLCGLFFLFKTLYYLLDNFFWSSTITLFFFTSPILVYYGNNFLTDSSAFAFVLVAWYFFIQFYQSNSQRSFYLSMLFFLIAGSFKIFALISFASISIVFIAELLGISRYRGKSKLFSKPKAQIIPFLLIIIIIGGWAEYAHHYNYIHQSEYFSTSTRMFSLWNMDSASIHNVIEHVRKIWLNQFFHVSSLYMLGGLFLLTLIFIKKSNKFLSTINLLLFFGTITYVVIFFAIFQDHDCYTINLYIFLIFIFITFISLLKNHFVRIYNSPYIKVVFFLFLIFNVAHARKEIYNRYHGWWTEYPEYKDYHTITPYLRSIGIKPLDPIVCLPDYSHFTLYLMNQRGWTECMGNNKDSAGIALSVTRGAKYLIVNGEEVLRRPYIQSFLSHPIGQYGLVRIYKFDNPKQRQNSAFP
jgi:hypothetical protein